MERIVDDQAAPARFVVLSVLALGDLRLVHRPETGRDWALALGALAVCLAGSRVPLGAAVTLGALLLGGDLLGAQVGVPIKAMIAVALFELALRRSGRRAVLGAAVTVTLVGVHVLRSHDEAAGSLYRLGILAGLPLLLGAYIRLTRENARQARERAAETERRRRSETLAARAAERTAIARELHDLVAHHVSSMVLRVGVARHVLTGDTDPRVAEVLDDLHGSGTAALADLRRLVALLRDPEQVRADPATSLVEPAGLVEALEAVLERGRRTGPAVTAEVDPAITGLDAMRGLAVLRLCQEGLANVARHAGPGAAARLSVRLDGATVRVEIADDGGRDVPPPERPAAVRSGGYGLIGMTERVELLGGRLQAGPVPGGRGWRLLAELPSGPPPAAEPVPGAEPGPALVHFAAPPDALDPGGRHGGPGR